MIATIATLVLVAYATSLWLGIYPGERAIARVQRGLRSTRRPRGSAPIRPDRPSHDCIPRRLRADRARPRGPPPTALITTTR